MPGSPEWFARLAALEIEELQQPLGWWYLSFATDDAFLGAAIVRAHGMTTAIREAHRLGINPGGQVMAFPCPDGQIQFPVNQLLSRAELGEGKTIGELETEGTLPGASVEFSEE